MRNLDRQRETRLRAGQRQELLRSLGPFRYEIGLAKDRKASAADALVVLGFTGLDWKITAIKPPFG